MFQGKTSDPHPQTTGKARAARTGPTATKRSNKQARPEERARVSRWVQQRLRARRSLSASLLGELKEGEHLCVPAEPSLVVRREAARVARVEVHRTGLAGAADGLPALDDARLSVGGARVERGRAQLPAVQLGRLQ